MHRGGGRTGGPTREVEVMYNPVNSGCRIWIWCMECPIVPRSVGFNILYRCWNSGLRSTMEVRLWIRPGGQCHAGASFYCPGFDSRSCVTREARCSQESWAQRQYEHSLSSLVNLGTVLDLSSGCGNTNPGLGFPGACTIRKSAIEVPYRSFRRGTLSKKISARGNHPTVSASRKPPTFAHPKFHTSPTSPDL